MELVNSTLAKVCKLVTDGTHDTPKRVKDGYALIKAKEIGGGGIDFETCDHISRQDHLEVISRSKPEQGDTLFAHIGASLGEAAYVNTSREFSIKNIALFKPDPAVIDGRYLYYLVIGPEFQGTAKAARTGSAQPFLSLGHLRAHPVRYHPEHDLQHRIVSILSSYDDLIEVNRRRIAASEEMAWRLFDEWFIKFRFPGHEAVKVKETEIGFAPEGWRIQPISETFEVLGGGTPSKAIPEYWIDGEINWYTPTDLTGARTSFIEASAKKITARGLAESAARRFQAYSVMMTSRATLGVIAINTTEAATNQGFITCIPNEHMPLFFLYHFLRANEDEFERHASGATFKEITKGTFKKLPILLPPKDLTLRFETIVSPMMYSSRTLQAANRNLRAGRDLLLPKLISGEIDLSGAARQVELATDRAAAE
jgi:type I restriction enzyme S subunit